PPIRMAIGLLTGVGLLVGCELRAARKYPTTANALDAAGIATLFATLFASHALWDLIPQIPTFAAMALVAAVPVALSVRRHLLFPIVQVGALLLAKREHRDDDTLFGGTTTIAAIVPLVFSLYLAAVPSYGAHMALLFGFVLVIGIGLTLVAVVRGPLDLHLIGA